MADTATTPITGTTTAAAAGIPSPYNWEEYQKKLGETVASAGTVSGGAYTGGTFTGGTPAETTLGNEAIKSYGAEYEAMQKQATQSATGLEMMGDVTQAYTQKVAELQAQVGTQFESAQSSWDLAAEKADEYVTASRLRVGETLAKLDEINQQIGTDRDFAKAQAMQASAQAVLGSMKTEERNILETYGANSKEYEQFRMGKQTALATAQSNIHANYQQFAEQQGLTYLNVANEAMWKQNMYISFQEQQHVEMLKYMADAKANYTMQYASFQMGAEQLKMAGMENLANWIVGTTSFTMDNTPLLTLLAELSPEYKPYTPPGQTGGFEYTTTHSPRTQRT
jgi:hypothetical protein